MENFTDQEIIAILESLDIALSVTVVTPPVEDSRIYREGDALWQKFGVEALARGIQDYAQYYPEITSGRLEIGKKLSAENSETQRALNVHDEDRFWSRLASNIAARAVLKKVEESKNTLSHEEELKVFTKCREIADNIFTNEGLDELLDVSPVLARYDSQLES